MRNVCYIVGAGEGFSPIERARGDLVIAADGGYEKLLELGISADVLIGDFDSLKDEIPFPETVEILRHPVRKDDTDTALAFSYAYEKGYREFVILGGTGGRSDHTFANYQLLLHARRLGANARLVGTRDITECLLSETRTFEGAAGAYLSLFAFGSDATGVTLEGLSYELRDGTLTADVALGVSNAFTTAPARISVHSGALLVIYER